MADPTTGPKLITHRNDGFLDDIREAVGALVLASLSSTDEKELVVVRDVIEALTNRMAEAHAEAMAAKDVPLPPPPKPAPTHVFERAEQAGKYRPIREQALDPDSPDPQIAALRYTASLAAERGLEPRPKRKRKPTKAALKKEAATLSRREKIVRRISSAATEDDGYRVQLIDMAAQRGGVYRESLDRVYAIETETLGRWEALARWILDHRQLAETQARDRAHDEKLETAAADEPVRGQAAKAAADSGSE